MAPIQISEHNLYPDLQVLLYKHLEKLKKSAKSFFLTHHSKMKAILGLFSLFRKL